MNTQPQPPCEIIEIASVLQRDPQAHKGTYGRALIIGGSRGMSGAPALAGMAALRAGAGLVHVAVPASVQAIVATIDPCFLTHALAEDAEGKISSSAVAKLQTIASDATAVAIGPGLGRSRGLDEVVSTICHTCKAPLVVDADAINAITDQQSLANFRGQRILTPHPGEFARLTRSTVQQIQQDRAGSVNAFFAEHATTTKAQELVLVLKGHESIVARSAETFVNETGNPGMATGGTGDVLTGVITALLAQGLSPYDAARLGVWVHGAAGDLAAQDLGEISLTARDLVDYLPGAFSLVLPGAAPEDEGTARSW